MDKDVFYEVIVPEHLEERIDSIGSPPYYETMGIFFTSYKCIPAVPTSYKTVRIPEKRYIFEKRKKAKKFCLENDYPCEYIHKREY